MPAFDKITPTNGFDFENLNNARQNNYAWSMSELGEYIYVGTGRNIIFNIIRSIEPNTQIPALIRPDPVDNLAEIWRYKKDGSLPWERVYKAPPNSAIVGFRFMINDRPFGGSPCIYAAAYGTKVQILKTTNGVNWFILPDPDNILQGSSSRAMVTQKGKLYLSTINELTSTTNATPLLYSSADPEFYPWELVIDVNAPGFDPEKNPQGAISNMAVFNNRIYVATSNDAGAQVWRTNGDVPKQNDWTLIVNNGFGDPANKLTLSIGVFKEYLYVGATKQLPLAWFIPMGCDIIRIDKADQWQLVVGGYPFFPSTPPFGQKYKSISGFGSGFSNPFNVYAWQIQEYGSKLYISTFDDSSNMEVIFNTLLANRLALYQLIGEAITIALIAIYQSVVEILRAIRYPIGFDLYTSEDGVHFKAEVLNGLFNPNNYGGRMLFVDGNRQFYLGTANPFQGCEVWKIRSDNCREAAPVNQSYYAGLWNAKKLLTDQYDVISQSMPAIMSFMSRSGYHRFV
jgi:hypothetical protein